MVIRKDAITIDDVDSESQPLAHEKTATLTPSADQPAEELPSLPGIAIPDDITLSPQEYLKAATFFRQTLTGAVEEVDISTGHVIRVHNSIQSTTGAADDYHELDVGGGRKVLISPKINADEYLRSREPDYSQALLDIICQKVVEGMPLTKVCMQPGMPSYGQVARWRQHISGVEEAIMKAREMRSEWSHDRVMEIAENDPYNMTQATHAKTKIEAYKWSAEKMDASRFGNKKQVDIKQTSASIVIIQTGVPDREHAVPDEAQKLREAKLAKQ